LAFGKGFAFFFPFFTPPHFPHQSKGIILCWNLGEFGLFELAFQGILGEDLVSQSKVFLDNQTREVAKMWPKSVRQFIDFLPNTLREHGLFPIPQIVESSTTEPEVMICGRRVIQFCTGNYLGLATHPEAKRAAIDGIDRYGMTVSGSRMVCGTQEPHLLLEREIADFQGTEDAVAYFLVTVANQAAICSIMGPPTLTSLFQELNVKFPRGKRVIFYDWFSHPSVVWASLQAVGKENLRPYRHNDMDDLERKLKKSEAEIKLIATDGLFSAEGDLARLPDIVKLAEKYGAMVFVDDAHATGVLGKNGRGSWEYFNVEDKIDIKVGSLSKAFAAGFGAFVVGDKNFMDILRVSSNHYIFGGSMPHGHVLAMIKLIQIARTESWRRKAVLEHAHYLRNRLNEMGFDTFNSEAQIVPILIGKEEDALAISAELLEQGFLILPFRYPAVPKGKARLRVNPMATHTREHIDRFLETFVRIADKYQIRKALPSVV
jgi:8-amino-7-oxononanoate synthase